MWQIPSNIVDINEIAANNVYDDNQYSFIKTHSIEMGVKKVTDISKTLQNENKDKHY